MQDRSREELLNRTVVALNGQVSWILRPEDEMRRLRQTTQTLEMRLRHTTSTITRFAQMQEESVQDLQNRVEQLEDEKSLSSDLHRLRTDFRELGTYPTNF